MPRVICGVRPGRYQDRVLKIYTQLVLATCRENHRPGLWRLRENRGQAKFLFFKPKLGLSPISLFLWLYLYNSSNLDPCTTLKMYTASLSTL